MIVIAACLALAGAQGILSPVQVNGLIDDYLTSVNGGQQYRPVTRSREEVLARLKGHGGELADAIRARIPSRSYGWIQVPFCVELLRQVDKTKVHGLLAGWIDKADASGLAEVLGVAATERDASLAVPIAARMEALPTHRPDIRPFAKLKSPETVKRIGRMVEDGKHPVTADLMGTFGSEGVASIAKGLGRSGPNHLAYMQALCSLDDPRVPGILLSQVREDRTEKFLVRDSIARLHAWTAERLGSSWDGGGVRREVAEMSLSSLPQDAASHAFVLRVLKHYSALAPGQTCADFARKFVAIEPASSKKVATDFASDRNSNRRWTALIIAGELRSKGHGAMPDLALKLVNDSDPTVRWNAYYELAQASQAQGGPEAQGALKIILASLDSKEIETLKPAIGSLGFFDQPEARKALVQLRDDPVRSPEIQQCAIQALKFMDGRRRSRG